MFSKLRKAGKRIGIVCLLCLSYLSYSVIACQVLDAHQTKLVLAHPARRVITLSPDLTEDLFAIGAGNLIVGTISASDFPREALAIPRVGSFAGLDLEKIILLHPDLIVTWEFSFSKQLAKLQQLNIPIYVSHPTSLEDIPHILNDLGCLTDHLREAKKVAQQYHQQLTAIKKQYAQLKKVTVFYQINAYSLMTINRQSWINQVIELCGGANVFADNKLLTPEVDLEAVIWRNPHVIIGESPAQFWERFPELAAVQHHHIYQVNPDLIARPGPRLLEGTRILCNFINKSRV